MQVHRQPYGTAGGAATAVHESTARKISIGIVTRERRITHQIADLLLQVAVGIKAKMFGCNVVAPFDATLCVQQHHTVG